MPLVPDDPPAADPTAASSGAASEEVLEAGRPKKSRTRRLREELLLAALVLGLVFAVARAMSADGKKGAAASTTSPAPPTAGRSAPDSGSGLLNGSVVDIVGPPDYGPDDVGACPATYRCLELDDPGPGAVRALVAAFPAAVLQTSTTVRLLSPNFGQPLWYRQITARSGANRIMIRVQRQRSVDVDRRGVAESEGGIITFFEGSLSKYHVVVQVTTPKGHVQPLPPVQKLASDVRLLALS